MINPRPIYASNYFRQWIAFGFIFLVLGCLISFFLYMGHQGVEKQESERLATQAGTLKRNIEPQLILVSRVIDSVINNISFSQNIGLTKVNQNHLVEVNHAVMGVIRSVLVVGASGVIVDSSDRELIGTNIAQQKYFQEEVQNPQPDILHISTPYKIPGEPIYAMSLFKTLLDRSGKFNGMVVATLESEPFSTLLSSVNYTSDIRSAIIHDDGIIYQMEPEWVTPSGSDVMKAGTLFSRHKETGQLVNVLTGNSISTGEKRMVAFSTIQLDRFKVDKPLLVSVSRNLEIVFESWHKSVYAQSAIYVAILILSALALILIQRWLRITYKQQKVEEYALARANRAFITLSACNEELVRSVDEDRLLRAVCQIIVEKGGYRMAWVGIPMHDSEKLIKPVAYFGGDENYLNEIAISWGDNRYGQGVTGMAFRTGATQINQNMYAKTSMTAWQGQAISHNFLASIALPLKDSEEVLGVLTIYTSEIRAFDEAEKDLLQKLADNLAFGITALRNKNIRKLAEEKLNIAAVAFESQEGIMIADANQIIASVNKAFTLITGYTAEEAIGQKASLLKSDHHDRAFYKSIKKSLQEHYGWQGKIWNKRKSGELYLEQLSITAVKDQFGVATHYVGTFTDITVQNTMEEELHIAAVAFESQEAIIIGGPNRNILRVNKAFTEITGYTQEESIGRLPAEFLRSKGHDNLHLDAISTGIYQNGSWQGETWHQRKNGEEYPIGLQITAVKNKAGEITHHVSTFTDLSVRKEAEEKIHQLAFYDTLTKLPNRRLMLDRLQKALEISNRTKNFSAIVYIGLDYFKVLNDTIGHEVGDQLLQQVSMRLVACVGSADMVARVGGDEFVVMLEGLGTNLADATESIEVVTKKILHSLRQSYQLGAYPYESTPSMGVILFSGHQQDTVEDLLKKTDLALNQAKIDGRNRICFFEPRLQLALNTRASMEADLRTALEKDLYRLHYQPQIDSFGNIVGAEALLRLQHPTRGLVAPGDFIALAEDTGLILPIGKWAMQTACRQLVSWAKTPKMAGLSLAVNVSAHQFRQTDFVEQVQIMIEETGANPRLLKFELTESALLDDVDTVIAKMNNLNAVGISFCLDDFGTGYSSLSYLKRLPLKVLKIDKSFVREIPGDSDACAIARTIITLAHSLNLMAVAEGVETQSQLQFLQEADCDLFQGYLLSRPIPLEEYIDFVKKSLKHENFHLGIIPRPLT